MRIRADLLRLCGKCGVGGVANRVVSRGFGLMRNKAQQKWRIRGELASPLIIARGGRDFEGRDMEVVELEGEIVGIGV